MIKRKICLRFTLLLAFLFCVVCNNVTASAEEPVSQLSFEHVSINDISKEDQSRLIRRQPQGTATADKGHFTLVYQPIKVDSISHSAQLPKTNDVNNGWLLLLGVGLSASAFILFRKKRKNVQLLLLIIGTSVVASSLGSVVEAAPAPLRANVTQTVAKGSTINYQAPEISGYQYVGYLYTEENNSTVNPTGQGKVTVSYLDEAGNALTDSVTLTGTVGSEYQAEEKVFAGYDFVSVTGNKSGLFTEAEQTVTFNYQKKGLPPVVENGSVTYKYQDLGGTTIHPDVSAQGKIGEVIPEKKLAIQGYKYSKTVPDDNQKFSNTPQVIIYQYQAQAQGRISFNLKISGAGSVRDYILQRLPQGSTIDTIEFAEFVESDDSWGWQPVPELSGPTFEALLDNQEVELINDLGAMFGSIADSKKDDINTLLSYAVNSPLDVLYTYTDPSGNPQKGSLAISSITTEPTPLDDVVFADDQQVTIILSIGIPN